jgi:hypothetical protein
MVRRAKSGQSSQPGSESSLDRTGDPGTSNRPGLPPGEPPKPPKATPRRRPPRVALDLDETDPAPPRALRRAIDRLVGDLVDERDDDRS